MERELFIISKKTFHFYKYDFIRTMKKSVSNFNTNFKSGWSFFACKKLHLWYTIYKFSKNHGIAAILFDIKITNISFFPKPKFLVLMIHALMLKLHLICKVGRAGPWNPIQHPSFWKTTYLHHKFFVRMLNLCTYAYSYPLEKGQFFPLHQGHKESVFPSLWVQNEW